MNYVNEVEHIDGFEGNKPLWIRGQRNSSSDYNAGRPENPNFGN